MLTLFTFGYYGWGNATRELVKAIDATERKRGFKPPIFFDIRFRRNVRAVGFNGNSFAKLLPRRYQWLPGLGNRNILIKKTRRHGIKIEDPHASRFLFEAALKYARENRRVIFFCSDEFPRWCHRRVVAKLLLKDAERTGHRIKITEWPGGEPIRTELRVTRDVFKEICRNKWNVPLASRSLPHDLVGLPWGSIVDVVSGKESISIISGPAKFRSGWILPYWEWYESNTPAATLRRASARWRKSKGIKTMLSSPSSSRRRV